MVRSILCAVDRSPSSLQAFDYAIRLAQWSAAGLKLIEVAPGSTGEVRADLTADLERSLVAKRVFDVPVDIVLRDGDVVTEILAEAEASGCDLVVMGSHGIRGVRGPIGSVAEQVLRRARCPVMTVRRGVKRRRGTGPPFRTILCPTDFSDAANAAMAYAQRIASHAGATLVAMTVVDTPNPAIAAERHAWLAQLAVQGDGVPVERHVAVGNAAGEIINRARARSVDLVVMGVSRRDTSAAFTLGSTTHQVLRQGEWPILSVPPDGRG